MLGRPALALLLLAVSLLGVWGDAGASPPIGAGDAASVIIQFRRPATLASGEQNPGAIEQAQREASDDRARLTSALPAISVHHDYRLVFNGVAATIDRPGIERVRALPYVAGVFVDQPMRISLADSVPLIGADDVWLQVGATGSGVRIAVVDTGVDYTHPDLGLCLGAACKVVGGYDFVNGDADPMDDQGHGTHVAGIAAANGTVKGVAPDASILAYKVLDAAGFGTESGVIAALEDAVDPDGNPATDDAADVVNLSLGGFGDPDDPISQAVDNAVSAGLVVAVAAGNSGPYPESIASPGTARKAITVGATDKLDTMAEFSSQGPVIWDGGAIIKPDIVAPGVDICSSRWNGAWAGLECLDAQHVALAGTSMATPHVAGAAALLLDAHPGWTPSDIKTALRNSALDLGYAPNSQGHGRLQVLGAAQLPHAPPMASIETSGRLTSVTDIMGTAAGVQFSGYTLEAGAGMDPQSWTLLQQSSAPVVNGVLKAGLDPIGLAEGLHTLRLTVQSSDGLSSEDRVLIEIDIVEIESPLNNDILRKGGLVEVTGSVFGSAGFQGYAVHWGTGHFPSQWSSSGITLTSGGTLPVTGGTLAQWNTSVIGAGSYFSLRIVITNASGQVTQYIRGLFLDPSLKAGWPQRIPYDSAVCPFASPAAPRSYSMPANNLTPGQTPGALTTLSGRDRDLPPLATLCFFWAGFLEPVVSDLDADGDKEIVVYNAGDPPMVRAYREDGTLLWSVLVGTEGVPVGNLHIPLVVDLDNDGLNEVLVYVSEFVPPFTSAKLYAIRHDGAFAPGWPVALPFDFNPSLLAADLDADGDSEIIVKGNGGSPRQMFVLNGEGSIVSQWELESKWWSSSIESTPAVGNLDGDPELEIVSADPAASAGFDFNTEQWDNTGVIYVYNSDGSVVPGWPQYTDGIIFSSPAVGDVDKNGQNEIVVGLVYQSEIYPDSRYGGLYVYRSNGSIMTPWPFSKGYNFFSSPALGDLDGNGDLEIAASRLGFVSYVLHHNGPLASGWPQFTAYEDWYSTIIADASGDGQPDVLTTAGGGEVGGGVYAWHYNGGAVAGFPKRTEEDAQAPAVVANIDADAAAELAASSDFDWDEETGYIKGRGSVYVWDLPGAHSSASAHWSQFHHDARHTGTYCPPIDSNGDALRNGCDVNNDDDMLVDVTETACGSNPLNAGSLPERTDTAANDDGDTQVNEALPPGAAAYDCDGDGFVGAAEAKITTSDQDSCGGNGWPLDLTGDNKLNIADFNSFLRPGAPNDGHFDNSIGPGLSWAYFGHTVPDAGRVNEERWDLVPDGFINIADMNALNPGVNAPTSRPPMFGGQPVFFTNLGQCPWPP